MDALIARIARQHGFTVKADQALPEIGGSATIMEHVASKAKLLYLKNDDVNKAFSITFKTPAADNTGVFHILEHSVLCGSKRFPVKEPFVNLLKSSMQTFLNAMTFPDKTMYPVASTNEKDLINLMDVYMDAVFNPNIYTDPLIFKQEGWHLEVDAGEGEGADGAALVYNGVVYNEMKGALSDPEAVLYDALCQALFPDTTYRFESGGTPAAIPTLSYEQFLDEHARHYRPDNAYIVLYGDMDIERFLRFLDEEYLSDLAVRSEETRAENPLVEQEPVSGRDVIQEMVTTPDNACIARGYVVGSVLDRKRVVAADILLDAIAGSNEAPLMRALMDAKIADDCQVQLSSTLLQPFVFVQAKGLKADATARLDEVIRTCITDLCSGGLDENLVEAALSHAEFAARERNFGYADGVVLSMCALHGWLYDDDHALSYIEYLDTFASLRAELGTGYYAQLLRELFLNNNHTAQAEVVPIAASADIDTCAADMSAPSDEDVKRISAEVEELRAAQMRPDDAADLAKLPKLTLNDIGEAPHAPGFTMRSVRGRKILEHHIDTHGIMYSWRYFDLAAVDFSELPYVSVLAMLLGRLDTARHSAAQIDTLVQAKLGNLSFTTNVYVRADSDDVTCLFEVGTSALSPNAGYASTLADEVLLSTDFDAPEKIKEMLIQKKVAIEANFMNAGHTVATLRALSYCMPSALVQEQLIGIDFYLFLKELIVNFEVRFASLKETLISLCERIFYPDNEWCSFAGEESALQAFDDGRSVAFASRTCVDGSRELVVPKPKDAHEAFMVPTDISFTALSANIRELASAYSGIWYLASRILSYDYLWNCVRVIGGAYGVGFQVGRSGDATFRSFRDPHIDETMERYEQSAEWLAHFEPTDEEFVGYIVAAIGGIDTPLKPRALVKRQDSMYITHLTYEDRDATRREVREANLDAVRSLADTISAVCAQAHCCTVGARSLIENSDLGFTCIDLFAEHEDDSVR